MGSLFLPFSAGAASPERTAESKSVPAAAVSAQEKVSQEKIVKENLKIAGTALMCAGTYSMGEGSSEHSLFSDYGWDVSPFRAASDDTDVHFAVAVSKKAYGRTYPTILAFRGSQTKTDWKTNFRASLVPFDEKNKTADPKTVPSVHEGFERYAATVLRTPMDLDGDGKEEMVAPYLKQHPDRRLYLTGHSLGGAVASLVAERLVEKGVPKAQVPVITFGAPAVGNKAFADVYGKRIDLIRVVTSLDPVPGSLQTFLEVTLPNLERWSNLTFRRTILDISILFPFILTLPCGVFMIPMMKRSKWAFFKRFLWRRNKGKSRCQPLRSIRRKIPLMIVFRPIWGDLSSMIIGRCCRGIQCLT